MILSYIFGLLVATSGLAKAVNITGYEYVVVGVFGGSGGVSRDGVVVVFTLIITGLKEQCLVTGQSTLGRPTHS
jgi:hypothetical protein